MTETEIKAAIERCKRYEKDSQDMPSTSETNEAIRQLRNKAKALRLELQNLPAVVRVNLPAQVRQMLEPKRHRSSTGDSINDKALAFIAKQEPELIRLLQGIETSLKGKTAKVNKGTNKRDDYADCVLAVILEHAGEYKSVRNAIYSLALKFNLDADRLYRRHTRK